MSDDLVLPRAVADELLAELPERIASRAAAELTAEFVRLCRSDKLAEAAAFWSAGVDRIANEVAAEFHAEIERWSAPEERWRMPQ